MSSTHNVKAILLGLLAYLCYSIHDGIVKYLGASYSPAQIAFFSVLFSFPLLLVMMSKNSGGFGLRPRYWRWTLLRSGALIVNIYGAFYAFSVLPLADTYAMLFTMPLFVTLLSIPLLGERVGFVRLGAILTGLAGVIIVLRPDASALSLGHLAALCGAFGSALSSVIVRRVGKGENTGVWLVYPMLSTFVVMGGLLPFSYKPVAFADLGVMALLAVFYFSALSCVIAAYKAAPAAVVAPMQYSQIIWAIILGIFLFDEFPDAQTLLGITIIVISGSFIIFREARHRDRM